MDAGGSIYFGAIVSKLGVCKISEIGSDFSLRGGALWVDGEHCKLSWSAVLSGLGLFESTFEPKLLNYRNAFGSWGLDSPRDFVGLWFRGLAA